MLADPAPTSVLSVSNDPAKITWRQIAEEINGTLLGFSYFFH